MILQPGKHHSIDYCCFTVTSAVTNSKQHGTTAVTGFAWTDCSRSFPYYTFSNPGFKNNAACAGNNSAYGCYKYCTPQGQQRGITTLVKYAQNALCSSWNAKHRVLYDSGPNKTGTMASDMHSICCHPSCTAHQAQTNTAYTYLESHC